MITEAQLLELHSVRRILLLERLELLKRIQRMAEVRPDDWRRLSPGYCAGRITMTQGAYPGSLLISRSRPVSKRLRLRVTYSGMLVDAYCGLVVAYNSESVNAIALEGVLIALDDESTPAHVAVHLLARVPACMGCGTRPSALD